MNARILFITLLLFVASTAHAGDTTPVEGIDGEAALKIMESIDDPRIQPPRGAIDPKTGKYYPPGGPDIIVDPDTGDSYPKVGPDIYVDPQTGEPVPTIPAQ